MQDRHLRHITSMGLAMALVFFSQTLDGQDVGSLEVMALAPDSTTSPTTRPHTPPTIEVLEIGSVGSFEDVGRSLEPAASEVVDIPANTLEMQFHDSEYPKEFRGNVKRDPLGRIWTLTREGQIFVYDGEYSWSRLALPDGYLAYWGFEETSDGTIWWSGYSTERDVVFSASGDSLTMYSGINSAGLGYTGGSWCCMEILAAEDGRSVWVVGQPNEGSSLITLLHFDGSEWRVDSSPFTRAYLGVENLGIGGSGRIWFWLGFIPPNPELGGTYVPPPLLISYDGREWRGYEMRDARTGERFWNDRASMSVSVDRDGSLWLSNGERLFHTDSHEWWVVYQDRNLRPSSSHRFVPEKPGRIWFYNQAPYFFGWTAFEDGTLYKATEHPNEVVVGRIRSFYHESGVMYGTDLQRLAIWRLPTFSTSVTLDARPSPFTRVLRVYPNPFNTGTTVGFELDRDQFISLAIYNTVGQKVRTLAERVFPRGLHVESWDGRGDGGRAMASGVYIYRLQLPDRSFSGTLALVR